MSEEIIEVDGKRYLKVQKGKYYDDPKYEKKKIKKHHPVRWILIGALTLFVIAPVGFIFGAFYDPSTKAVATSESDILTAFKNKCAVALKEIPSEKKLNISIDESFMDGLLGLAAESLSKTQVANYMGNFYCYINGNNYEFVAEAKLSFFKTKIHVYTTIEKDDEYLRFKINNIALGRLPLLGNLTQGIITKFITDDTLNNVFKSVGMNATFSLANKEITYNRKQFREDMTPYLNNLLSSSGMTFGSVLFNLIDQIIDPTSEEGISFKDGISIKVDLTKLTELKEGTKTSENRCTTRNRMSQYNSFVESAYNKGYITDSAQATTLLTYLIKGYTNVEGAKELFLHKTEFQEFTTKFIKETLKLDETYETYKGDYDSSTSGKGYRDSNASDIIEILQGNAEEERKTKYSDSKIDKTIEPTQLKSFLEGSESKTFIYLKDDLLSDYLRSLVVKPIFASPLKIGDQTYIPSMSISDFSMEFYAENTNIKLVTNIDLDLYGLNMPIVMTGDISTSDRQLNITLDKNSMTLGQISMSDIADTLFTFMKDCFTSGSTFSFETIEGGAKFTFDISSLAQESSEETVSAVINDLIKGKEGEVTKTISGQQIKYDPSKFTISAGLNSEKNNILQISMQKQSS